MTFNITEDDAINAIKKYFKGKNSNKPIKDFNQILEDYPIKLFSADQFELTALHYNSKKLSDDVLRYDGFIAIPYHLFLKKSDIRNMEDSNSSFV